VGRLVHRVVEEAASHPLREWAARAPASWERALAVHEVPVGDVEQARVRERAIRLVRRLSSWASGLPGQVSAEAEVMLASRDGRLRGRADLVLRADDGLHVVDVKTGRHPRPIREVRPAWERQLRLYSALLADGGGGLPRTAHVAPLVGPLVEVDVSPPEVSSVEREARQLLDDLNACEELPLTPSRDGCRWCWRSHLCPAPWRQRDWSVEETGLLLGTIAERRDHGNGATSLVLADTSWGGSEELIRAVEARHLPPALAVGARIALRGAYRDEYRGTVSLGQPGEIRPTSL
jgi:RecB family exonuclease